MHCISTNLEGKVFQAIGNTRLGLVSAASLEKQGNGAGGLVVVHSSYFEASSVGDRSKGATCDARRRSTHGRGSSGQHL